VLTNSLINNDGQQHWDDSYTTASVQSNKTKGNGAQQTSPPDSEAWHCSPSHAVLSGITITKIGIENALHCHQMSEPLHQVTYRKFRKILKPGLWDMQADRTRHTDCNTGDEVIIILINIIERYVLINI